MALDDNRFPIVDNPPQPAKCAGCFGEDINGRRFVDTGTSLDYYGAVLICTDCADAIAYSLGFVPVAEVEQSVEALDAALNREAILLNKLEVLESVVFTYGLITESDPVDGDSDGVPSEDVAEDAPSPAGDLKKLLRVE